MIPAEALEYLLRRGYTEALVAEEGMEWVEAGSFEKGPVKGYVDNPSVIIPIRSMSERVIAWQTVAISIKEYRTFYDMRHMYCPMFYGSEQDRQLLWETGQTIITEGVFDRIAIKRAFPERSVIARLTKGLSPQIIELFNRVAKRVWLAFDMDKPGEKAALKSTKRLGNVDVVRLEYPYKDPGLFYEQRGVDEIRRVIGRQILLQDI